MPRNEVNLITLLKNECRRDPRSAGCSSEAVGGSQEHGKLG